MNFKNENTFDLNEIIDRLDEVGHQRPSDDWNLDDARHYWSAVEVQA